MGKYLMALDQGTTSSRAIIFNKEGKIISLAQKEFEQIFPRPGWVEHDPLEIWSTQMEVAEEALVNSGIDKKEIATLGITNQRETTVVWDKNTGQPVYNAIVWQCRRTADICRDLKEKGLMEYIRKTTGLVIDSYFSGTKIKWILDNVQGAREKALAGDLLFGTIDTWLLWKMTRGEVHATDYSNASRTMLFDINKLTWDTRLLEELSIPASMLPEVKNSSEIYGYVGDDGNGLAALEGIPIGGIAGDQQAALFGQSCFQVGQAKNTYGTGCFLLMNIGDKPIYSDKGLLTTIAWGLDGKISYALEGSIFMGGAIIKWLRDELEILKDSKESQRYAEEVEDNGGVYLVPAFTGLGAPYWDMQARGTILGLTRGSNKRHIVRAGLEAIAYQSRDVLSLMEEESKTKLSLLRVDGGATANDFLMQFQADILDTKVLRPAVVETTAFGAAALAGLAVSFYKDMMEIDDLITLDKVFVPDISQDLRDRLYGKWQKAVTRALDWETE